MPHTVILRRLTMMGGSWKKRLLMLKKEVEIGCQQRFYDSPVRPYHMTKEKKQAANSRALESQESRVKYYTGAGFPFKLPHAIA